MSWKRNQGKLPVNDPSVLIGGQNIVSYYVQSGNTRRSNGNNLFHYCLNQHVDGQSASDHAIRLASVPRLDSMVWMFDSKNLPAVGGWNFVHTNLHGNGAQFLFLDGHAARFRNTAYWNFAANAGRTNNPALVWMP